MTKNEFIRAFLQPKRMHNDSPSIPIVHRESAVMVLLIEIKSTLYVLLTKRSAHLRHHPGQISFPGGKRECSDPCLMHTAIRETQEEIGIALNANQILGRLPVYATLTGFSMAPYLGVIEDAEQFELSNLNVDYNEVSEALLVPYSLLSHPDRFHIHSVTRAQQSFDLYFIKYQSHTIWGATAAILYNLSKHLNT